MVKEPGSKTATGSTGWVQDQLYQLKAQVAQQEQQLEHLQSTAATVSEGMRTIEASLRETALSAAEAPRLQEQLNQALVLVVQLQDQQAEAKEKLEELGRHREAEEGRDQLEWADLTRRTEQMERQVASWQDRQAGVDEVGRRFQEGMSLLRQQIQQIEQRLEEAGSKAARGLEGANRAENSLSRVDASILALQREDEAIAERTRVTADVAHRLETTMNDHLQELQRLELLAERIELHRAERQRLEDRALRLEEELGELRGHAETAETQQGRLSAQQQGIASRLDSLQETVDEQRAILVDQIRRLIGTQDRTKRRQIQELEREIRETKQYVADLTERENG
jgi:chromosome segregation ATPase